VERVKNFFVAVGAICVVLTAVLTLMGQIGFSPTLGPEAANAALAWLGDPCDGIEHPAYKSKARTAALDGIRDGKQYKGLYVVETLAVKGEWAYAEASPYQGPGSGELRAYILTRVANGWGLKWEGQPGALPGQQDYPEGFDDNLLRCKQVSCAT
jgi:hypothetical protein